MRRSTITSSTATLGPLMTALVLLIFSPPVGALDFVVTETDDVLRYGCPAGGPCSLRDAVWAANTSSGPDTIELPAGTFHLSIAGNDDTAEAGDLDITGPVIIAGKGPSETVIDATDLGDRVFHIAAANAKVGLANLTITGGYCGDSASYDDGGGIYIDSTIVVLSNVRVKDNRGKVGGGIYSYSGGLTVQDGSVIIGNRADGWAGGLMTFEGFCSVINSTITTNTTSGASGGGFAMWDATCTISGSTISYNSLTYADSIGGGLYVHESIYGGQSVLNIANSTIAGNRSVGGGGGIAVSKTATVNMLSVTIDKNQAHQGQAVKNDGYMEIGNTIIVGYCAPSTSGFIATLGGNIESPLSTCGFGPGPNDQAGVDPMMGPLGDFGGPTATILPLSGSPAIGNLAGSCPTFDQRGFLRADSDCDSGAVERLATDPSPLFFDGFELGTFDAWSAQAP